MTHSEILFSLKQYQKAHSTGTAIGDNVGFIVNLPNRRSFSPDAAFWAGRAPSMRFYEGAPLFAVEVRSESDYGLAAERAIAGKLQDYFAAGTQAVWEVDLLGDIVIQLWHAANVDNPECFKRGSTAHAEPVLPRWQMQVNKVILRLNAFHACTRTDAGLHRRSSGRGFRHHAQRHVGWIQNPVASLFHTA